MNRPNKSRAKHSQKRCHFRLEDKEKCNVQLRDLLTKGELWKLFLKESTDEILIKYVSYDADNDYLPPEVRWILDSFLKITLDQAEVEIIKEILTDVSFWFDKVKVAGFCFPDNAVEWLSKLKNENQPMVKFLQRLFVGKEIGGMPLKLNYRPDIASVISLENSIQAVMRGIAVSNLKEEQRQFLSTHIDAMDNYLQTEIHKDYTEIEEVWSSLLVQSEIIRRNRLFKDKSYPQPIFLPSIISRNTNFIRGSEASFLDELTRSIKNIPGDQLEHLISPYGFFNNLLPLNNLNIHSFFLTRAKLLLSLLQEGEMIWAATRILFYLTRSSLGLILHRFWEVSVQQGDSEIVLLLLPPEAEPQLRKRNLRYVDGDEYFDGFVLASNEGIRYFMFKRDHTDLDAKVLDFNFDDWQPYVEEIFPLSVNFGSDSASKL